MLQDQRPTAVYARLSLDRHDGAGIERQLGDCRALAAENGWEPVVEYVDPSVSASRFSRKPRPAYLAMLAAAEAGEVGRIVVWHLDRLYRQPRELEPIIDLADRGLVVVDVMGGEWKLDTGDGRYKARIDVAAAAKSSDDASRRIRRQKQQARERGVPMGGPRPFGWRGTPAHPKRWTARHPTEARLISDAMEAAITGRSLAETARIWNAARVKRPHTGAIGTWTPSNIRQVLVSPRHAGLVGHAGAVVGSATWEPIVSRETWERCLAALDARSQSWGTTPRRRSLLTGMLVCGLCDARMVRATQSRRAGNVSVWRCPTEPGKGGCGRNTVLAEPLDDAVTELALAYLDRADPAAFAEPDAPDGTVAAIMAELGALDARDQETAALAAAGKIRPAAFAAFSSAIEARQRTLRDQLARASSPTARWAGNGADLRSRWAEMTLDEHRAVLKAVLGAVAVEPAGLPHGTPESRLRWPVKPAAMAP